MYGKEFYEDLGKKIRARRKARHLTLADMAAKLNKSVATISKYELGEIAITVDDLLNICTILEIDASSVLPITVKASEDFSKYKKFYPEKYYLYWLNREKNQIRTAVFINEKNSFRSTLYWGVANPDNVYDCHYVYSGYATFSDTSVVYQCRNIDPPFDILMCRIPMFHKKENEHIGLLSTVTSYYQSVSIKVYISQTPISNPDSIIDKICLSSEELKEIKRTNFFTIW